MIQRTLADGSKLIIPDGNITRKLNAIAKFEQNRVVHGMWVRPAGGTDGGYNIEVTAGQYRLGNTLYNVNVATIQATIVGYPSYSYATVYIPSGSSTPTVWGFPTAATNYAPGTNEIKANASTLLGGNNFLVLAHIKNTQATYAATMIDNQVKPRLFSDTKTWDKHYW